MSDQVRNIKSLSDPLYFGGGSFIGSTSFNTNRTNISGPVFANGNTDGNRGWSAHKVSRSGTSSSLTLEGVFYHEQRWDLQGLYASGKCLVPLGSTLQRSEPFTAGLRHSDNNQLVREYVLWTTEPLSEEDFDRLVDYRSSPPYFNTPDDPASMNPSQVVSGQVGTHIAKTDIPAIIGALVPIHESALGFGDTVASPYLYCTRIIAFSIHSQTIGFWLDIPSGAAIMSVVEDEPEDLLFLTKAVKSLDPPNDTSSP